MRIINQSTLEQLRLHSSGDKLNIFDLQAKLWHPAEIKLFTFRGTLLLKGSWKKDVLVNCILNKLIRVLLDKKINK